MSVPNYLKSIPPTEIKLTPLPLPNSKLGTDWHFLIGGLIN